MMKQHKKYMKLINLKIDGRLSVDEDGRLMKHLDECEACRSEYEVLNQIRNKLLTAADVPLDPVQAEKSTAKIMAAVRDKAATKVKPRRSALKPILGFVSLLLIFIVSMAILHKSTPPGKGLYSNPDDREFDTMLVELLNEHEHLMALEAFSDPLIIAGEKGVNNSLLREAIK